MLIDLTERDADLLRRILDTFQQVPPESLSTPRPQPRPPSGTRKNFVEITSTTQTDGRYPGTVYDRYDVDAKTWTAGDTVWVVDSLGTTLATGKKYEAKLWEYAGVPERAVYMTDCGIISLGGLTAAVQTFSVGTSGTDFAISSSGAAHTFNLPSASLTARGVVNGLAQHFAGTKFFDDGLTAHTYSSSYGFPANILLKDAASTGDLTDAPLGTVGLDNTTGDMTIFAGSADDGMGTFTTWIKVVLNNTDNEVQFTNASGSGLTLSVNGNDGATATVSGLTFHAGLYISGSVSASISDGDKGDITTSSSGTVWTIDNDAVTYAKIQNVSATDKVLGRVSTGAGDVEEITFTDQAQQLADDTSFGAMRTTLGATTVGGNLFTLTNPSAITFIRINADNTVDALSASSFRTAIGAGTGTVTGSGTTSTIPRWSGSTALGDSTVTDDGTDAKATKNFGLVTVAATVAATGSTQSDLSISSGTIVLFTTITNALDFTGMTAATFDGRIVVIVNTSSYNVTIKHNVTSTAANRFHCPGNVDYVLGVNGAVQAIYYSSRWHIVGAISFAGSPTIADFTNATHNHQDAAGGGTLNAAAIAAGTLAAARIAYYGAQAYNSANISHATSGSWQSVTLNSERFDTTAFHSTSSNTQRMTVPSGMAGKYEIKARIIFDANATGSRGIAIDKNGMFGVGTNLAFDVRAAAPGGSDTTACQTTCIADLAVGDYVEMSGYQNSGGALNMLALFTAPELTFTYLGA